MMKPSSKIMLYDKEVPKHVLGTASMTQMPLPPEWLVRMSRSKGRIYYYHTPTATTQWSRPTRHQVAATNVAQERAEQPAECESALKRPKRDLCPDAPSIEHERSVFRALIASSMRVGGTATSRLQTRKPVGFTPWPHQVTAVEKVITAIQTRTTSVDSVSRHAECYLLQHSTGAGKTLTIAALAHQLLHVKDALSRRFHTVLVMLDRIKLHDQVGDTVTTYLRRNGVDEVYRAETIAHLATLVDATTTPRPQKVIITTVHKMQLLVKDSVSLTRLLHRRAQSTPPGDATRATKSVFQRVAIITDEAHRSHSLSLRDAIETGVVAGDNRRVHLTFIGLTATPNVAALELFGSRTNDACRAPFHCYPIAEATADGRIMNLLADYTCVSCKVETSVFPHPVQALLQTECGARRRVLDHASTSVAVLQAKAGIMMTDFQTLKRQYPEVKCMIVARRRLDVVRYYQLITAFVAKHKLAWNCYAVFSGAVTLDTTAVTEQSLNPSVSLAMSDIVIVCDKLDTGYNEPLLACMYVDRYLRASTHTVQLLSRVNRRHEHKPCTRVVDFANHPAQVRQSFADFWHETRIASSHLTIDARLEKKQLVTAVTILCDYFPELCASPSPITDPRTFVNDRIVPLERDAFQQVLDALRGAHVAYTRLAQIGRGDYFDSVTPFRYDILYTLKQESERHVGAVEPSVQLALNELMKKMSVRVQSSCRTFSGALYPQSLLDRVEGEMILPKTVACLLQFGPLEQYEALLALSLARNKQQTLESCTTTQVIAAAMRFTAAPASLEAPKKDESRILGHIRALRSEFT